MGSPAHQEGGRPRRAKNLSRLDNMAALMNLPELLGFRSELQVMKRWGDKVDAGIAALLAFLGVLLYSASFSGPKLACVPMECPADPLNPNCALDWSHQSRLCEQELLSYPDATFHLLLLLKAALFLSVLVLPIFYGNKAVTDQFTSISSLWKLRSNSPVTGQVEWRRRMQLVLRQLQSSTLLTRHYSLYHALGLGLDSISLTISLLYSLHFLDYHLPEASFTQGELGEGPELLGLSSFFQPGNTECQNGTFHCEMPKLPIYKAFGLVGSVFLTAKVVNRLYCLGFSLGIPGLFGRNVLLHCSRLTDINRDPVYNIESRPAPALLVIFSNLTKLLFIAPLRSLASFLDFYFYDAECKTAITLAADDEGIFEDDDTIEGESAFLAAATAAEIVQKKKGGEKTTATTSTSSSSTTTSTSSTGRLRKREELGNWADLFFVLDVMSGSIDVCEILVFISKTDPLVRQLEEKRVDSGKSFLDSYDHKLTILFTDVGSLEQLLEHEVEGGLEVRGWLEGPRGRVEGDQNKEDRSLTFSVDFGSSYELVSAVFARGRQLVRLPSYKVSLPSEIRLRLRKRHGHHIPLYTLGLDPRAMDR